MAQFVCFLIVLVSLNCVLGSKKHDHKKVQVVHYSLSPRVNANTVIVIPNLKFGIDENTDVSKFPPFLEYFVQRLQAYFSTYGEGNPPKYSDKPDLSFATTTEFVFTEDLLTEATDTDFETTETTTAESEDYDDESTDNTTTELTESTSEISEESTTTESALVVV